MSYRLTRHAEHQIFEVIVESDRRFGPDAAERYRILIFTTLDHIGEQPDLLGSTIAGKATDIRRYPLRLSRQRIDPGQRVAKPRHSLIYRVPQNGHAVILGLVHDRMMLSRAVRRLTSSL